MGATQGFGPGYAGSPCLRLNAVPPRPNSGSRPSRAWRLYSATVAARPDGSMPQPCQLIQAGPALEIAAAQVRGDRQRRRTHVAEAVATQEAPVADQPGACRLPGRGGLEQGGDIVVVTVRLIDEAPAVGQHADHPGLAALDDVREVPGLAIAVGNSRDRRPGDRRAQVVGHPAAGAGRRRCSPAAAAAAGCPGWGQLGAALRIMGKAAAGQDHGACLDAQESLGSRPARRPPCRHAAAIRGLAPIRSGAHPGLRRTWPGALPGPRH